MSAPKDPKDVPPAKEELDDKQLDDVSGGAVVNTPPTTTTNNPTPVSTIIGGRIIDPCW
jgi:hypothetical protein